MEKKSVEVIVGKRSSEESTQKPILKGMSTPGVAGEAGGRAHQALISCPWCGAINNIIVSDYNYYRYECWNCGNTFDA